MGEEFDLVMCDEQGDIEKSRINIKTNGGNLIRDNGLLRDYFLQFIPFFLISCMKMMTTINVSLDDFLETILLIVLVDSSVETSMNKERGNIEYTILLMGSASIYCLLKSGVVNNRYVFIIFTIGLLLFSIRMKVYRSCK